MAVIIHVMTIYYDFILDYLRCSLANTFLGVYALLVKFAPKKITRPFGRVYFLVKVKLNYPAIGLVAFADCYHINGALHTGFAGGACCPISSKRLFCRYSGNWDARDSGHSGSRRNIVNELTVFVLDSADSYES